MNIHPILVHFPIAFMTIYAIAELIRYKKISDQAYWFYVKATLVIVGTLGAFLSLQTGEIAEELYPKSFNSLIELHANFANISTYIFGFIAIIYLTKWISHSDFQSRLSVSIIGKWWSMLVNFSNFVLNNTFIMMSLSLVGLITISITGALGGAIVYGPEVDPIVGFIYGLFF